MLGKGPQVADDGTIRTQATKKRESKRGEGAEVGECHASRSDVSRIPSCVHVLRGTYLFAEGQG